MRAPLAALLELGRVVQTMDILEQLEAGVEQLGIPLPLLWLGLGMALIVDVWWYFYRKPKKTDEAGLIKNDFVGTETVWAALDTWIPRSKPGNTRPDERSFQVQLDKFLRGKFVHVAREFSVGGLKTETIDHAVGDFTLHQGEPPENRVGIELKMMGALLKSAGKDRLLGQAMKYGKAFQPGRIVVLALANEEELGRRSEIKELEDELVTLGVIFSTVQIHDPE